jgi:hypothetical protein
MASQATGENIDCEHTRCQSCEEMIDKGTVPWKHEQAEATDVNMRLVLSLWEVTLRRRMTGAHATVLNMNALGVGGA